MGKIHPHLIEAVSQALDEIFFSDRHAEKIVESLLFRNKKWGSRDRRFVAESIYQSVRWWRKIWYVLGTQAQSGQGIVVWQISYFLQHKEWALLQHPEVLSSQQKSNIESRLSSGLSRDIENSIPVWLDQLGEQNFAERWPKVLAALNTQAPVDLRVNEHLASRSQVKASLLQERIETEHIPGLDLGLTLRERKNVFITQSFRQGLFEVQDRGSQKLADLLPVSPGDRVIDACAGAGGKTLQMATKMKNKGKIIALDIHAWKLEELKKRAARARVSVIETRTIDSTKVIKRLQDSAHAVLLDVPCSGLGVLRRHPDSKWKMSVEEIHRLQELQLDLLMRYSEMTQPSGHLVYATCSWLRSENEDIVEQFLQSPRGQNWQILKTLRLDPDQDQSDGFFGCLLQKSR